jgi:hypothetical protein
MPLAAKCGFRAEAERGTADFLHYCKPMQRQRIFWLLSGRKVLRTGMADNDGLQELR